MRLIDGDKLCDVIRKEIEILSAMEYSGYVAGVVDTYQRVLSNLERGEFNNSNQGEARLREALAVIQMHLENGNSHYALIDVKEALGGNSDE